MRFAIIINFLKYIDWVNNNIDILQKKSFDYPFNNNLKIFFKKKLLNRNRK
jgi:hypothetical protein